MLRNPDEPLAGHATCKNAMCCEAKVKAKTRHLASKNEAYIIP